jgi:hypothetical protein
MFQPSKDGEKESSLKFECKIMFNPFDPACDLGDNIQNAKERERNISGSKGLRRDANSAG